MRKSYKKLAVVLAVMILALAMTSTSFAENVTKNLKAYYRNITVYRNGAKVNFSNEPFILDDGSGGSTYVPLRDVSAMLGKEVKWDGTNYRIDVNDGPADANTVMLQTKVVQQEIEITKLKNEIATLKTQLEDKTNTGSGKDSLKDISTIKEMNAYIQDNYETKDKYVDFDITVSGTKNSVTVAIEIDKKDKDSSNEYKTWKSADKEDFAQDIVDDIIDALDSDKVSGYYRDNYKGSSKESFTVSKKGVVSMGSNTGGGNATDLDELEDDITEYYSYEGVTRVRLSENSSGTKLTADIYVDYDDWDDLSSKDQNSAISSIVSDILDFYNYDDIDGAIIDDYDGYIIATFDERD